MFTHRGVWQSCLDVEAALAEVQAELGLIPGGAAVEIRSKANLVAVDVDALAADIERTRAPILSLARALSRACAGEAGGYVHWGATTQNVRQTARTLLMRRGHDTFMVRLGDVLEKLAGLAESSAETLTVGRTHHRHALPITFGFKAAAWIEELLRHRDRLVGAEPRVFLAQWGGAIGAMHAFGEHGPEINRRLSRRVGLFPRAGETGTYQVTGNQITKLTCECCGDIQGTYLWDFEGSNLSFTAIDDTCANRKDDIDGSTWMKKP